METLPWIVALYLANLQTYPVKAEDRETRCESFTATEGETAFITYHLRPNIDYSTRLVYIRRDGDQGHILMCDSINSAQNEKCDVNNLSFRSEGILGTTLTLEAPNVTLEQQGSYFMYDVDRVNGKQQTPCACNLTVVAKPDSIASVELPPKEDGATVATVVGVVVGLLVCIAIGVGLSLYRLVTSKRRKRHAQRPNQTREKEDLEKGLTQRKRTTAEVNGFGAARCGQAGDVRYSQVQAHKSSEDITTSCVEESPASLLVDKEEVNGFGAARHGQAGDVRYSQVQAQESSEDIITSCVEESPASLLVDKGEGDDTTKPSDAEGETTALLDSDASDTIPPYPPTPPPDTEVNSKVHGPIDNGDGEDTTKASEAKREKEALLDKGASAPTLPAVPSASPDTGLSFTLPDGGDGEDTTNASEANREKEGLLDKGASAPTLPAEQSAPPDTGLSFTLSDGGESDDTTKASEAEGETTAVLDNDASDSTPPLPTSPPPDTGVSHKVQGPIEDGDGEDTTKAKREKKALFNNGASAPTLPAIPPAPPYTGVSFTLPDEGEGEETTQASKAEGETTGLLENDASDSTPPFPTSPPPETGVSFKVQGHIEDGDGKDTTKASEANREKEALLDKGASVSTLPAVPPAPPHCCTLPNEGSDVRVSVDVAGPTDIIAPVTSVDMNGHSREDFPADEDMALGEESQSRREQREFADMHCKREPPGRVTDLSQKGEFKLRHN